MNKSLLQTKLLMGIKNGKNTLESLASDLDKSKGIVDAFLAYMIHDGYIEEVSCDSKCRLCIGCTGSSAKMYALTSKGLQYIKSIKDTER